MYILLKFNSARLYRNHKGTRNKHIEISLSDKGKPIMHKRLRKELGNFKEPISVHQISNVIHCLFGERPVPTFRKTAYSRDEYLFNKAKESLLYIREHFEPTKSGKVFANELNKVAKSDHDAWDKNVIITWETLKYYLSYDYNKLGEILSYLQQFIEEPINASKPYSYYVELLREVHGHIDVDFFKERKVTAIYRHITDNKYAPQLTTTNNNNRFGKTISSGIHNSNVLDGEILVPVNEEDIERLRQYSTGSCTILDGGVVKLVKVVKHIRQMDIDMKYKKVSDLSDELIYL